MDTLSEAFWLISACTERAFGTLQIRLKVVVVGGVLLVALSLYSTCVSHAAESSPMGSSAETCLAGLTSSYHKYLFVYRPPQRD